MSHLVAVIDIGKTNKKIGLFDDALRQVASVSAGFPAQQNADGILCEQTDAIWTWLKRELSALYRQKPFHAIAVSTHGACWAALAGDGSLAIPVIAYEHALDDAGQRALDDEFYRRCGPADALQAETGTCDLPLLINPAKAILFAQRRLPQAWARAVHIVNYPQYWGFLLTGARAAEATYSANHSFLFDFRTRGPSRAATALGVAGKIDTAFRAPWDRLGTLTPALQAELKLPALPVAVGIHDSNAALLPYLVRYGARDFVLNSTGTWCVAMHRAATYRYRPEELGQKVIFNLDALGQLQKVSFLMGGQDYALYHDLIGGADPGFDAARVDRVLAEVGRAILPGAFPSQFPGCAGGALDAGRRVALDALKAGRGPAWLRDAATAHDLLNVSLALQSEVALRRTDVGESTAIFVEGGFRNNPTFLAVLAALFPSSTVACTNLDNATACGAALLGHALLRGATPQALADRIHITEDPIARPTLPHLAAYRAAWQRAVA